MQPIKGKKIIPEVQDFIKEHKKRDKKRKAIYQQNRNLIAYWDSIPWWQFWKQPSFEEKRDIILSNWQKLDNNL